MKAVDRKLTKSRLWFPLVCRLPTDRHWARAHAQRAGVPRKMRLQADPIYGRRRAFRLFVGWRGSRFRGGWRKRARRQQGGGLVPASEGVARLSRAAREACSERAKADRNAILYRSARATGRAACRRRTPASIRLALSRAYRFLRPAAVDRLVNPKSLSPNRERANQRSEYVVCRFAFLRALALCLVENSDAAAS